jgi:calcineurin-like phosphoesterase family protein
MYWFTADEHYGHRKINEYCKRPFSSVEEMDEEIACRHNTLVQPNDVVIHAGDFTLTKSVERARAYVARLSGKHIFVRGSHDYWLRKDSTVREIWQRAIGEHFVVVCHYAMRVWPRSHYNAWLAYGHSHGRLEPIGKSWDVGVDNNDFYPVSFDALKAIMDSRPDNPNLVRRNEKTRS